MSRGDHREDHRTEPDGRPSGHVDDWEDLAVDFIDGRLDRETTAAIEGHLEQCPTCAARLRAQQNILAFLRQTPLQQAPAGLEDQVLDEVLMPAKPVRTPRRKGEKEPFGWSALWRRTIRPWIPATVGVAAVLLAIVGYGLLRPSAEEETAQYAATTSVTYGEVETTSFAYRASDTPSGGEEGEDTVAAAPSETATTAAPMTTTTAAGETTTTAAGETMTTAADALEPAQGTASIQPAAAGTQDRKTMIAELEDAGSPAFFVFDTATLTDEVSAEKAAASIVEQITALTGLQPLESALSLGAPTFAAFVPRDDATQFVDLLRSIAASVQVVVSLDMQPPEAAADATARLLEQKSDLPELSAHRTPQPAVSGWSFTTSTLAKSREGTAVTGEAPPDEAGTHVLVVIYLQD